MSRRRQFGYAAAAVLALAAVLFIAGPRVPVSTTIAFDADALGDDLDAYLARSEGRFDDIRDGLAKTIVWADPATKQKTPLSIVYVHGFSASSGELRPLPDQIANSLGANLFYTRLSGHGRDGAAMAEASVQAWVDDISEAIAIGRRLGDRVVILATSTGATLATWALTQDALAQDVAAAVLISPNFGIRAWGVEILTMPWGGWIARQLLGETRGFMPRNALHARYWTTQYPTDALLPMAALVALGNDSDLEAIRTPALFVYSPDDRIVRPDRIEAVARRWGGPVEEERVTTSGDPDNHVIAGDAISPQTTDALAERVIEFVDRVVGNGDQDARSGRASRENR